LGESALSSTGSANDSNLLATFDFEIKTFEDKLSIFSISNLEVVKTDLSLLWPALIFVLWLIKVLLWNGKEFKELLDAHHVLVEVTKGVDQLGHLIS